jgi:DNA-binding XRE family transcriptional regulator
MAKKYFIHPIKRWRFEHGLSLDAAAKRLHISQPTLVYIENRKRLPSMRIAVRIRDKTGLSLDVIADAGS